jgi:hypothetical protein
MQAGRPACTLSKRTIEILRNNAASMHWVHVKCVSWLDATPLVVFTVDAM